MTQPQPPVPPGWFPDPWGSPALRWWDGARWTGHLHPPQPVLPAPLDEAALAALPLPWSASEGWFRDPADPGGVALRRFDGRAWTNEVRGSAVATQAWPTYEPPRPPLPRGWFALATWTQVLLGLCAVDGVVRAVAMWWANAQASAWADRPQDYDEDVASRMDDWDLITSASGFLLLLVTGILFICWLHQVARSDRVPGRALRRGAGWAIGSWFVPVGNLWLPVQTVNDVRRAGRAGSGAGDSGGSLVGWWWAAWIASTTLWNVSAFVDPTTDDDVTWDALAAYYATWGLAGAADVVAAVLAVLVVRHVTAAFRPTEPA